jgi:hypothetical protein
MQETRCADDLSVRSNSLRRVRGRRLTQRSSRRRRLPERRVECSQLNRRALTLATHLVLGTVVIETTAAMRLEEDTMKTQQTVADVLEVETKFTIAEWLA